MKKPLTAQKTFLLGLATVVLVAGAAPPPAVAALATLWGQVTDSSGAPLAGAEVEVVTLKGPPLTSRAETNGEGEYRLPLPAQKYDFRYTVRKEGYQVLEGSLETGLLRTGDTSIKQNFVLQSGEGAGQSLSQLASDEGDRELHGSARALYNDAATKFNAGDLEGAEKSFRRALRDEPTLTAAHVALAEIHLRRHEAKQALEEAGKALEQRPDDHHALEIQHDAYIQLDQQEEASRIRDLLIASGGSPALAVRVFNEAVESLKGGDLDQAIELFEQAAGLDPELLQAREALAKLQMRRGDYDAAFEQAEKILAEDPLNPVGQGVYEDVERIRQAPPSPPAAAATGRGGQASAADELVHQASDLLDQGEPEQARGLLEKALGTDAKNPTAHYLLGRYYIGAGDNDQARQHLERFLELDPKAPEAERARELLAVL
ncbi:MAG: tetratricopeptide repeat protein [Acidobacteria bacterium]|nr:tetratricopeptide repeat protein [Acidobacteriota bacterium]